MGAHPLLRHPHQPLGRQHLHRLGIQQAGRPLGDGWSARAQDLSISVCHHFVLVGGVAADRMVERRQTNTPAWLQDPLKPMHQGMIRRSTMRSRKAI